MVKLNLLQLKFQNASFYNSAETFKNIEMQIDVNHELQPNTEDKSKFRTKTMVSIYPKNPTSIDGEFKVRMEMIAVFEIADKSFANNEIHNETFRFAFPYLRSAVASLLSSVEFPVLHIPFMEANL